MAFPDGQLTQLGGLNKDKIEENVRKYLSLNEEQRTGGGTRKIVLYTWATRETRKKGCFFRLNVIHANSN